MPEPRHLEWPDCRNVRDLGGLTTNWNSTTVYGALIRSDGHHSLTPEGLEALHAAGVSRIVDVRRPLELLELPSPLAGTPLYLSRPVQLEDDYQDESRPRFEVYLQMLELRPNLFASAVAAVAEAPPGAVVVHCASGKDRTGMVTALILALVGVQDHLIASDYALTEERLRGHDEAVLARVDRAERELLLQQRPTPPENILKVLRHMEERHGGVGSYLRQGGLTESQANALRARLCS